MGLCDLRHLLERLLLLERRRCQAGGAHTDRRQLLPVASLVPSLSTHPHLRRVAPRLSPRGPQKCRRRRCLVMPVAWGLSMMRGRPLRGRQSRAGAL
jgi:hypothetical protein